MRLLSRLLGGSMVAIGATVVVTALVEVAGGGDGHTSRGVYAGMLVFFSALTVGGWRMWRGMEPAPPAPQTAPPPRPPELNGLDIEQRILAAAARSEGRVTIGEVAMLCRISIARAKQTLEDFVSSGAAELLLTDGGDPVYRIAGLVSAAEKDAATDPLADVLPEGDRSPR